VQGAEVQRRVGHIIFRGTEMQRCREQERCRGAAEVQQKCCIDAEVVDTDVQICVVDRCRGEKVKR
jgi:hypothetical protein